MDLSSLNDSQREAVLCNSSKILCMAGAGTGKTHTLISRLLHLTENPLIDPESMLVLTFTRAAASEFRRRFMNSSQTGGNIPWFSTFHSFCYSILDSVPEVKLKLGYNLTLTPDIATEYDFEIIASDCNKSLKTGLPKKAYSPTYKPKPSEKFKYESLQKKIRKELSKKNLITFDILSKDICDLFISKDPSVEYYSNKFKYIFVDEFQDTDPVEWEFVQSFESTSNIFVVGDIRQSLYRFRGADSSIMKNLSIDEDWTVYKLEDNYRSTNQICEYANGILEMYKDSFKGVHLSGKFDGPEVNLEMNSLFHFQIGKIVEANKSKSLAILCRTNREVGDVSNYLIESGIDVSTKLDKNSDLVKRCAVDESFYRDMLLARMDPENQIKIDKLSKFTEVPLGELERLSRLNISREVKSLKDSDNFKELEQRYLLGDFNFSDNTINTTDAGSVYVGTIHSVKGLEFDSVVVYGVESKCFKLTTEDNLNCYYVACTRPKSELTVFIGE